ncbi:MAG: adenosylcobinamide-GDP ribazoletransferase [Pseudomonadota bacterium]
MSDTEPEHEAQPSPQSNGASIKGAPSHGAWMDDMAFCIMFFTRLPVAHVPHNAPDYTRLWRAAPVAGAMLGVLGSIVVFALGLLNAPAFLTAAIVLGVLSLLGGALHDDGLADVADGFGGGHDRTRKMEIMRDSHIGSYGVFALILFFAVQLSAIAAIYDTAPLAAALALIAIGGWSRMLALLQQIILEPARSDGLGATMGPISLTATAQGIAISGGVLVLTGLAAGLVVPFALAAVLAGFATWGFAEIARSQIGGYTGDTIGAAQQIAHATFLISLALAATG